MFDLQLDTSGPFAVARASGDLGEESTGRLMEALGDVAFGPGTRLAIDLSNLKTVDSSGLAALISVVTRSRMTEGRVVLVAPSPFVSGILNVTRLDQWFEICADMAEAGERLTPA